MKRWGLRHKGFRVAFIGIVVCSVFFVIGFAAPAWQTTNGLWMDCSSHTNGLCVSYSSKASRVSIPAWFDAVRAMECFGLAAVMCCIAAEVYMDFLSEPAPDRRLVELLALLAGAFGLCGTIIFATFTPVTSGPTGGMYRRQVYLSWGFGLTATASCFLLIFASILAYFRRKGLDVARYPSSNPVHYRASDGTVIAQGFNGTDLAPPPYSEVVSQPVTQPGGTQTLAGSQPHPSQFPSEYLYFKPAVPPDSQPPPVYYPPPPNGQFQAPPAYTSVHSLPTSSGQNAQGNAAAVHPSEMAPGMGLVNPGASLLDIDATSSTATVTATPEPEPVLPEGDSGMSGAPVMSAVPAYYVTVLGQAVPVFPEELQQAGQEAPSPAGPVPAYFIVTHGQHVPVYTEEQARALTN